MNDDDLRKRQRHKEARPDRLRERPCPSLDDLRRRREARKAAGIPFDDGCPWTPLEDRLAIFDVTLKAERRAREMLQQRRDPEEIVGRVAAHFAGVSFESAIALARATLETATTRLRQEDEDQRWKEFATELNMIQLARELLRFNDKAAAVATLSALYRVDPRDPLGVVTVSCEFRARVAVETAIAFPDEDGLGKWFAKFNRDNGG